MTEFEIPKFEKIKDKQNPLITPIVKSPVAAQDPVEFDIPKFEKIQNKQNPLLTPIVKSNPEETNDFSVGITVVPHIQGTDGNDRININSEVNKSIFPGSKTFTIDGGKGNDTFIIDLKNVKDGTRFFIEDTQGINTIHLTGADQLPQIVNVHNSQTLYELKINNVTFFVQSKQNFDVSFDTINAPSGEISHSGVRLLGGAPVNSSLTASVDQKSSHSLYQNAKGTLV